MSHPSVEKWAAYATGQLPERERAEMEEHLAGCDECLEALMQCLEQANDHAVPLEPLADPRAFDEAVMRRIGTLPKAKTKSRTPALLYHPLFRYAVAAAVTALLMSAGVFQGMKEQAERWQAADAKPREQSVSARLAEQASDWLGKLQTAMLSRQDRHVEGGLRQ